MLCHLYRNASFRSQVCLLLSFCFSSTSASDLHCLASCLPACLPPPCCQVRVFQALKLIGCWSDFVTLQQATHHRAQCGLRMLSVITDGKTSCLLGSILICHAFLVVSSNVPWLHGAMTALTKSLSFCWFAELLFTMTLHFSRNCISFRSSLSSRRGCGGKVRCCRLLLP